MRPGMLGTRGLAMLLACVVLTSCSDGGGSSDDPAAPRECTAEQAFDGTFAGIQTVIFEKHGCTQQVCHGSAAQGGLDLSPEVAYANLVEVPSQGSRFARVTPGDKERSSLWRKLAAKTNPGSVEIEGAPMPNGLPAISEGELEALRLWIYAGAPRTGTVGGTETLLDACLPEPEPITIKPLDPPPAGEGVQLVMPPWHLAANSEDEVCFATYYDITDQVPESFRDPSGRMFRFRGYELRQDPQSHHLILYYPAGNFTGSIDVHDPAFGAWTCAAGERDGQSCEPTDAASCPGGFCRSERKRTFACIGFGPDSSPPSPVGGAQQSQALAEFPEGVYAQLPMKGVLYWNSHAFNLTGLGTEMNGRLNYPFAEQQSYPVDNIFDASAIFAADTAPYTRERVCNDHVLPRGARLFELSSHTHKHGKHFTIELLDGTRLYESFVYNDPVRQRFDPPLEFDSADPADRTLRYCSLFDNGVADDGSPDPEAVTRASRIPESASQTIGRCKPIACTVGQIGAPCDGRDDDATCDSAPGAGDGECDACRITGGESTENEMFLLLGQLYRAPVASDDATESVESLARAQVDDRGRSLWTGLALPGHLGCGASPMAHASHASGHGAPSTTTPAHTH